MLAEEVVYYRETSEIIAIGNIVYQESGGNVFFGEKARFNHTKETGIIVDFKARFGKYGQFAANYAQVLSKDNFKIGRSVYSPCVVSDDNFIPNVPLWQIRADEAVIDMEAEDVTYSNVTVQIFGKSVMYLPYLYTPAPKVKNKSGLLIPRFRWSRDFGFSTRVPLYLKIKRNSDFTFGITMNEHKGDVYDGEYRHRLMHGDFKLGGSITYTDKLKSNGEVVPGKNSYRGHIYGDGNYKLDENTTLLFESKLVKDPTKTYLKKYKFSNEDVLNNNVEYISIKDGIVYDVRALYFQDLRPDANQKTTAAVLPQVDLDYNKKLKSLINSNLRIRTNYTAIERHQGSRYHRFVGIIGVNKNFVGFKGLVFKNTAQFRADYYDIDRKTVEVESNYKAFSDKEGVQTRTHSQFISSMSWPLKGHILNRAATLEPIVQGIVSSNISARDSVENEDSQSPEISVANLFSVNKFKGLDLIEDGSRLNYGIRGSVKMNEYGRFATTFGQSIRSKRDQFLNKSSGMSDHRSDYVLKGLWSLNSGVFIMDNMQMDSENFNLNKNQLQLTYYNSYSYFGANHFLITRDFLSEDKRDLYRQELTLDGGYNVMHDWWLDMSLTTKLGSRRSDRTRMISNGFRVRNKNQCLNSEFSVKRNYTSLRDLKPSTTYSVKITIPNF